MAASSGRDGVDVLAVGAHPDDVELGCGGTLALLAGSGRSCGVCHLTRGEAGTRGSSEERQQEAEEAAKRLGLATVRFLDCGDGALRTGRDEEDALIAVIRRLRPELVLAPAPADRHPDHGRAHRLVRDACFYAGLAKRRVGSGSDGTEPHRPALVLSYMQHDLFEPRLVVDVTSTWPRKLQALEAYRSQFYVGADSRREPATKISSPEFLAAVEGRGRQYGLLIGAAYGEPFWSSTPVAVADPWQILPRGLR